ncbi:hypothetical protein ONS95_006472 [Cadophora gregata]|uniref:uncharacterized protein n=1 Tax=Cadophora gregata TaxID=51156 RepID=UPI0026DC5B43|nr:uncharacterized protein ONS95_006472 [Cadophora gregata]KAK0101295.1 hypothetical protein ONS95_006472 [Cadophora gregata]KAK0106695.1 hypothetical protein ONS96_004314 [Cadophora gregata f. sp. sojae]
MEARNELGFLVSGRYYSSDFDVASKRTELRPQPTTVSPLVVSTVPSDSMGSSQSSHKQSKERRSNGPNLLDIPLEIRLHIYHYVLLSHPIHHAHLAPLTPQPDFSGLNTAEFHTTMIRSNDSSSTPKELITRSLITHSSSLSNPTTTSEPPTSSQPKNSYTSTLLASSPYPTPRIQGRIPTALLASNKQIFAETSHLPWHRNTFSFINWFWSGIYAARQFSSNLPAWQRESIRNVAVEVLGKDLWVGGMERRSPGVTGTGSGDGDVKGTGLSGKQERGVGEWRELCGLWGGVRNLKLTIKGGLFVDAGVAGTLTSESSGQPEGKISILNTDCEWVSHGLQELSSLRTLELEIEDTDVPSETKMAFCASLEQYLNNASRRSGRTDSCAGDIRVVLVEKTKVVQDCKKDKFVYYGGEPGDESVWAEET